MLQETKLGHEDPTPFISGYDTIRLDRSFSGTRNHRRGGLITYIRHGIPYLLAPPINFGSAEMHQILIPTARRVQISFTNMYVPPASSSFSGPPNSHTIWLLCLPTIRGLICGDFNAHHVSWHDFVQAVYDWLEDNDRILLNDGSPAHHSHHRYRSNLSAPDLTIADPRTAEFCSLTLLVDLSCEHLPMLVKWEEKFKIKSEKR